MATTYKIRINSVDAFSSSEGLEKVIYNVHWSYIGTDENNNVGIRNGVQSVQAPDPENFVPFENLLQSDIVAWIEPLIDVDSLKTDVDLQISEKVAPTRLTLYVPEEVTTESVEASTEESLATEETTEETV